VIKREPDKRIGHIVAGGPGNFNAARATALGFRADTAFDEIIKAHIEDELGRQV
jgi:D-erythronate 2-dehydrogenase